MIFIRHEIYKRSFAFVRSFLSVIDRLLMITRIMSDNMPRVAILEKTPVYHQKDVTVFSTKL